VLVHLHLHTPFSFLDAVSLVEKLVEQAAEFDIPALAITDHNSLSGAVCFHKACRQTGIEPIIGAEVTVDGGHHLTLLAQNRTGYANLCQLLTAAHLSNQRASPRLLKGCCGNMPMVLSPCRAAGTAKSSLWHTSGATSRRERWLSNTAVSLA